jgi:hypothetical protein
MRAGLIGVLVFGCAALLGPAFASAAHAPSPAQQRGIAEAARAAPATQGVRGKFLVRRVRISEAGSWARASLTPKPRYVKTVQSVMAVFRQVRGSWRLRDLGTDGVGCSIGMPPAVRRDLELVCRTRSRPATRCSNETYYAGKYSGRQTLRFLLIRGVSCGKAHALIKALYHHLATGNCEGDRCITELGHRWNCSLFVAPESAELGGAVGGCLQTSTGAKLRVYSALRGFLSPDRRVWCSGGYPLSGPTAEVGCVTSPATPNRGAVLGADGSLTLCTEVPAEIGHPAPWGCYQNFDPHAPVLAEGESVESAGFRCVSAPDGITCTLAAGSDAGKGFRISKDEVVEVG